MSNPNWTPEEDKILELWTKPETTMNDLIRALPHRTYQAISSRLKRKRIYKKTFIKDKIRIPKPSQLSLAEMREIDLGEVKEEILREELSKRGFTSVRAEIKIDQTYKFLKPSKPFKLGIISCSHLGSEYQQLTLLNHFYQYAKDKGVDKMLVAGDVVEGNGKLYRGQLYEMFLIGSDSQREYAIKAFPKVSGIKSLVIAGNHDYSFFKMEGYDIVKAIVKERKDMEYLGITGAYLKFGDIKIYMMHKTGGVAYARSYRMQKIIEQFPPEQKPHILVVGGDHVSSILPNYRNVVGINIGCFQAQTPYMKAKGINPDIMGYILTITPDKKGIHSVDIHWKSYFEPISRDY